MYDLARHPFFEEYVNPVSGVKSYLLKNKVASLQYNLYFTHMGGITYDEEYLWFKCVNWPSPVPCIGVLSLNPDKPFIRCFHNSYYNTGLPSVVPGTHNIIFGADSTVYQMDLEGNLTKILEIDKSFTNYRKIDRLSTHLSFNANGELILLDMRIGGKSYIATGNYNTGEIKHIHKFVRHYNHAQFSPTKPEIFLLDEDWERDPVSGERFDVDKRMWIMDIHGTRLEPIDPENWFRHNNSIYCHDFWSQDGWLCWPDMLESVYEYNIDTKEKNLVWRHPICHAHTVDRKYWVGDASPYNWDVDCSVIFFDRECGREFDIFTSLPKPKYKSGGIYHNDPHPSFSKSGNYIVTMVTIDNGEIDIAITPTAPLIEQCKSRGKQVNTPTR